MLKGWENTTSSNSKQLAGLTAAGMPSSIRMFVEWLVFDCRHLGKNKGVFEQTWVAIVKYSASSRGIPPIKLIWAPRQETRFLDLIITHGCHELQWTSAKTSHSRV